MAGLVASALPACAASDLTLSFEGENGAFETMRRGGTPVVVRNVGIAPCRVPALPPIAFAGRFGGPDARVTP